MGDSLSRAPMRDRKLVCQDPEVLVRVSELKTQGLGVPTLGPELRTQHTYPMAMAITARPKA